MLRLSPGQLMPRLKSAVRQEGVEDEPEGEESMDLGLRGDGDGEETGGTGGEGK